MTLSMAPPHCAPNSAGDDADGGESAGDENGKDGSLAFGRRDLCGHGGGRGGCMRCSGGWWRGLRRG